ncbi:hypothetical protein [Novosphingobium sp. BL-52-GroH]|uniref:hypothetical protein n=1 Tax=Novosphingobium sp. BL-52-GroH TaxID=3349877 RepID=UPI003850CEC8
MTFITSRPLLLGGDAIALGMLKQTTALAGVPAQGPPRPALLQQALSALAQHQPAIRHRDAIGIVDFSQPSRVTRLHIAECHKRASCVSKDIVRASGKLGRSQRRFAVAQADISHVFERFSPGRMIYAGKI